MRTKTLPSVEALASLLRYDPESGSLYWRQRDEMPRQWNTRFVGTLAGAVGTDGINVQIKGFGMLKAHRIIWKMVHGTEPEEIDHIDGNPSNNAISNLRAAAHRQNMHNRRTVRTGLKGAYPKRDRWYSKIVVNGASKHLGIFFSEEEAHAAYIRAAQDYFGEFARTS